MGHYQSLHVWCRAHELALDVYKVSHGFPRSEIYGLTAQMRRAAVSIAANLAEGCGRNSDREVARFARISLGSANELDYYVLLARELGYLEATMADRILGEVRQVKKMLAAFCAAALESSQTPHRGRKAAATD